MMMTSAGELGTIMTSAGGWVLLYDICGRLGYYKGKSTFMTYLIKQSDIENLKVRYVKRNIFEKIQKIGKSNIGALIGDVDSSVHNILQVSLCTVAKTVS